MSTCLGGPPSCSKFSQLFPRPVLPPTCQNVILVLGPLSAEATKKYETLRKGSCIMLNVKSFQIENFIPANYQDAAAREKECRHDVMSHVYAYGLQ